MGERCRGEIENALNAEPIDTGVAGIEKPICRLHINAGGRWRTVCGIRVDSDLCTIPGSTICPNHGTVPGGVMVPLPTSTRPPDCGSCGAQLFPKYGTLPPSPRLPHVSSSYVVVKFDPPIQLSPVIASVSAPVFQITKKLLVVTVLLAASIDTSGTGVLPVAWANAIGAVAIALNARKVETIPKLCAVRVSLCVMPASTSITGFPFWIPGLRPVYIPPASPCVTFSSIAAPAPSECTASQIGKSVGQPTWSGVPSWTAPQPALFEHSSRPRHISGQYVPILSVIPRHERTRPQTFYLNSMYRNT